MIARLSRIVRDLSGAGRSRFSALLAAQLDAAIAGVRLAEAAVEGRAPRPAARVAMRSVEHDGDRIRSELVQELSVAIVTPFDPEDLFRISRSIDDVLDNLSDLLRECDLFEPAEPERLGPAVRAAHAALLELRAAVGAIDTRPREIARHALAAKKRGNEIRRLYDEGLAALFRAPLGIETLKARELLRRLDVIGLRLHEAADALADAAIKRHGAAG